MHTPNYKTYFPILPMHIPKYKSYFAILPMHIPKYKSYFAILPMHIPKYKTYFPCVRLWLAVTFVTYQYKDSLFNSVISHFKSVRLTNVHNMPTIELFHTSRSLVPCHRCGLHWQLLNMAFSFILSPTRHLWIFINHRSMQHIVHMHSVNSVMLESKVGCI